MRIFFSLCLASLLLSSCYYDNEEYLYGPLDDGTCDTLNVSYSVNVKPILEQECFACHDFTAPGGGVVLTEFSQLQNAIIDGSLLGAIKHEPGFSNMPKSGNQLPACDIQRIEAWVQAGAPNN